MELLRCQRCEVRGRRHEIELVKQFHHPIINAAMDLAEYLAQSTSKVSSRAKGLGHIWVVVHHRKPLRDLTYVIWIMLNVKGVSVRNVRFGGGSVVVKPAVA